MHVVVVCVRHVTVRAVEPFREVGLGPPVAGGRFDVLPLYVLMLRAKSQSQPFDGYGVYRVGAREPLANFVDGSAREGIFDVLRY